MKNFLHISLIISFLAGFLFASSEKNRVGFIKSMQGQVAILRDGDRIDAKSKDSLYKGDSIRTVKFSKASIEFIDKTLVHIGKSSELKVDDYVYDGDRSKVALNAKEGLFQIITGKIGKINPDRFNVKTSSVTIGIRGTVFDILNINDKIDIGCFSGDISVVGQNGSSVRLTSGEQITLKHSTFDQSDVKKAPHSFFTLSSLSGGYYIIKDINNKNGVIGYQKNGPNVTASFKISVLKDVNFEKNDYLEIDKNRFEKLKFLAK